AMVGFDENEVTLQAIQDGYCIGTVVQNPYEYGYQSVKVLADVLKGGEDALPENTFIDIPARSITRENVDTYWAELRALTSD
ncbi:MAG: substrate-binding domain-containing protein, partial [Phycisphaeraceae bacterium]